MTSQAPTPRRARRSAPLLVLVVVSIGAMAGLGLGAWASGFLHLPVSTSESRPPATSPPLLGKPTFPNLDASYAIATRSGGVVVGAVTPPGGPVEILIIPPNGVSPSIGRVRIQVAQDGHSRAPRLTQCGTWCYRVPATALRGSTTTMDVQIRGTQTKATLTLPPHIPPDAAALYRRAVRRMTAAHGLVAVQTLSSGGPAIITHYTAEAPDRLQYTTSTGQHTVLIGHHRWDKHAASWVECPFPGERDPTYVWQGATAARLGGQRIVDGRRFDVVLVLNPTVPAWFTLDMTPTGRVEDVHMLAPSHFMHESYRLEPNATVTPPARSETTGAACS